MNENPFKKIVNKAKPYVAAGLATFGSILPMTAHSEDGYKKAPQQSESINEIGKGVFSKEYKSDSAFYRAVAKGVSPDVATAKKLAVFNAKTDIAQEKDLAGGAGESSLSGSSIIEEHLFQNSDGGYTYWVAVEMPR